MTPEDIGNAIRAFRSRSCPACDSEKADRFDPFCGSCLDRLPSDLHEGVSSHKKFIESFGPSLSYLRGDGTEPKAPDPGEKAG